MDYLESLNEMQKEAVLHTDGPLLILAGAGAGKTKTLTHRIAHLIHTGVFPEKILAVTFTNKAAAEMKERVKAILSNRKYDAVPHVSTFHSLGVFILKKLAGLHGLPKSFSILDDSQTTSILKEAMKEAGLDPKEFDPRRIKNIISREKNLVRNCEDLRSGAQNPLEEMVVDVWERYERKKQEENAYDFDDLLTLPVSLLENHSDIREKFQNKWDYIHIDEYQDTNEAQYRLATLLSSRTRNLCVVGDIDQTIYTWRGANIKNILSFESDYSDAKVVILEENYRSTQTILNVANVVIKKNKHRKEKNLFTRGPEGEKITIFDAYNEYDEASFVGETAQELVRSGVEPKEIAVLYRANFQSRVLEEAMLSTGLPYQVLGTRFFDRKEIKDLVSYIRASQNKQSLSDVKRIINEPKRGIGKTTLLKLFTGQESELPIPVRAKIKTFYGILDAISDFSATHTPSEVVTFALKKSGLEDEYKISRHDEDLDRLENLRELVTFSKKYDGVEDGLNIMIEDIALQSDQDTLGQNKESKNAVKLMTVHASKGLEFGNVFIVGLEMGLFQHERGITQTEEEGEEERRLFYVALTRAKKKLYLSYANTRTIFGERRTQLPSEFLSDVPDHAVEWKQSEYFEKKSDNFDEDVFID